MTKSDKLREQLSTEDNDLKAKRIDHAAGYENKETDYHDKIINLLNKNKTKINKIWHTILTSIKEQENMHLRR